MATQGMITGVSAIYKRLLNHRPVIQNEVQFFVKEFEGTRGNSDHQSLKATVDVTNEVESLLQEIAQLSPLLKKITDQVHESNSSCDAIFTATERQLELPREVQQTLDAEVAEHHARIEAERYSVNAQAQEKLKQLKSDITRVREARMRLQTKITVARPSGSAVEANTITSTTTAADSTSPVVTDLTPTTAGSTQTDLTPTTAEPGTSARLETVTSSLATPAGVDGTPKNLGVEVTPAAVGDGGVTVAPNGGVDTSVDTTPVTASSEVVAGGDGTTPSPDSV
eukprot:Em0005g1546a